MSMAKKAIAVRIANETGIPHAHTLIVVRRTFEIIKDAIAKGVRVRIDNFGCWTVKIRQAKMGRDLRGRRCDAKTAPPIIIPRRGVVKFLPGKDMTESAKLLTPKE